MPESLTWSPNSRWLAYTMSDGTAWLMDIGAFDPIPIPGIQAGYPASLKTSWSPDGEYLLVYGVWDNSYPQWTAMWLVAMTGEGAGDVQTVVEPIQPTPPVYQNEGILYTASWSPDGRWIVYPLHGEAWVYDLESGLHKQWTHVTENVLPRETAIEPFDGIRQVAFSQDGTRLALEFTCNCPSPWSGVGVIYLIEDNQEGAVLLVDGARLSGWSPDGRWITLQNVTGDWAIGYTFDSYGVSPTAGELVNLTRSNPDFDPLIDGYDHYQPASFETGSLQWGEGGQYLYQTVHWESGEIALALGFILRSDPETIVSERTPSPESWFVFPFLASDGRLIYVEANPGHPAADTSWNIFQLRQVIVDGEVKFEFREDQNRLANAGVWSPNGLHLAIVRPLQPGSVESEVVIIHRGLGLNWPYEPTVTPGPTPTAAFVHPTANEPPCTRPEGLAESRVGISQTETDARDFCVVWVDDYDNEVGIRIVLTYGNGDIFVYEVPANSDQLIVPKEGAPRLGESLEQHLRRTSWQLTVYAIGPDFLETVGGMGIDVDSFYGIYLLPTATPSP